MINEIRSFSAEKNKIKLNISLFIIGKDVLLILSGGTHPHIGSLTFLTETENIKIIIFLATMEDAIRMVNFLTESLRKFKTT